MIRDATVSDARAIAAVHVASWDGAYRGLLPDRYLDAMDVERWTNGWRLVLTRERPLGAGTVVAGVGASVVGFADATPSRDDEVADATPSRDDEVAGARLTECSTAGRSDGRIPGQERKNCQTSYIG